MNTVIRDLVCNINTSVTQNTTCHVQLYLVSNIYFLESATIKFVAGISNTMLKREILQMTFTSLITNRTIQWMINQKYFNNTFACFYYFGRSNVLHFHSIHHTSSTRCDQLRHRARILF